MIDNLYKPIFQEHAVHSLYDLVEVSDKNGILEIKLVGPVSEKLSLVFDSFIAYRKVDEGDAQVVLSHISALKLQGLSFYEVEKSSFVEWFVNQTFGVRDQNKIKHIAVHTVDDVIDVLSLSMPEIVSGTTNGVR
jgi:hypothetical protein